MTDGTMTDDPQVQIFDEQWQENGSDDKPWARLLVTLYINGVACHLEAIAVEEDSENDIGMQCACDTDDESTLDALAEAASPSGQWDTMEIRGREYVVFATPHC